MSLPTPQDRFAPFSRDNPVGYRTREITITARAKDGDDTSGALDIAISSEAPVERWDWSMRENGGLYDEVLDHGEGGPDLSYCADGIPFCVDHHIGRQVGIGTTPTIDADRVMRTTVTPGAHPDAAWVFADMRSGVRKKVSIGYWPGEDFAQTKGEDGRITRRYRGWMLYEASSVAVPADYAVGVGRSANGRASVVQDDTRTGDMPTTQEIQMAEVAAERGAPPTPDTRATELAALARNFPTHARLAEWIGENTTVDAARDEVMRKLAAAADKAPEIRTQQTVTHQHERGEDKPWQNGEFFQTVIQAERAPETMDVRLKAQRAVTGSNVGNNAEGGFAVPPGEVNIMFDTLYKSGEILKRVRRRPITVGNTYSERLIKETSRASGSRFGGITTQWTSEGGSITASKPELREVNLTLRKLTAACYLTEEQIADGPALQSYVTEATPEAMRFDVENAIYGGSGAGQPLGFLTGGSLVSVAIEGSQTIANTNGNIWMNAAKMFGAMPASLLGDAAWFINQELWAKILTATAGTSGGSHPMFTPPGRLEALPNGGIYGKPIVPVEYASAEGTVGDFVFANFSDYLMIDKGGINQAVSMHVRFLNDEQVLKFTYRVDGSPRTLTAMTPLNGTQTQSPYIALAARS